MECVQERSVLSLQLSCKSKLFPNKGVLNTNFYRFEITSKTSCVMKHDSNLAFPLPSFSFSFLAFTVSEAWFSIVRLSGEDLHPWRSDGKHREKLQLHLIPSPGSVPSFISSVCSPDLSTQM